MSDGNKERVGVKKWEGRNEEREREKKKDEKEERTCIQQHTRYQQPYKFILYSGGAQFESHLGHRLYYFIFCNFPRSFQTVPDEYQNYDLEMTYNLFLILSS
jgi:hypothetical protein